MTMCNQRNVFARITLLLIGLLSFTGAASAAVTVTSQSPCVDVAFCIGFTQADTIPVIRKISISAPSAGKAYVTFHGSMTCVIPTGNYMSLDSQIVTGQAQVANKDGPGGLQHKANHPEPDIAGDLNVTFNLASTRVVQVAGAGNRNFFFKINKVSMAAGYCVVHNATLSVIFIP